MSILVVGGGKMGLSHLAILSRLVGQPEVTLCESSPVMRFLIGRFGYQMVSSLDGALKSRTRWAGAVIATPTTSHFAISKALLERGIPCFIEKPLTLDPAKSQELVDASRGRSVITQMGLVGRFIGPFLRLRGIIQSKALGSPIRYRAQMLGNVITRAESNGWRGVFAKGGGCLNEYGPHLIDLCRYFFGDVAKVNSAAARQTFSSQADDAIDLSWTHESGCVGDIALDWCDSSKRKAVLLFEVQLDGGMVRASSTDIEVSVSTGYKVAPDSAELLFSQLHPLPVSYYLRGEEFTLQMEVFLESITGRKFLRTNQLSADTAATIMDGLEVDKLIREIVDITGLS